MSDILFNAFEDNGDSKKRSMVRDEIMKVVWNDMLGLDDMLGLEVGKDYTGNKITSAILEGYITEGEVFGLMCEGLSRAVRYHCTNRLVRRGYVTRD